MHQNDFKDLKLDEIGLVQQSSIIALRKGFQWKVTAPFRLESRLDKNIMTDSLCHDLESLCSRLDHWFYIKDGQNNYLIYKDSAHAFVFKIRNSNPVDTQNIRDKLSNGRKDPDQNANMYVANQVSNYLNNSYNVRLKEALQEYTTNQICFFHWVWCLSENEVDRVYVRVTYTYGYDNNNQDWYLHLISDTIIQEQANETVNDDLVNKQNNIDKKANIIKPKRFKDDQRKQSV